jgi:hypothetical protein
MMAKGLYKKEIGDQLRIREDTVRTHCSHMHDKLRVTRRGGAVAKVVRFDALPATQPGVRRGLPPAHNTPKTESSQ